MADMPSPPAPVIHPGTKQPIGPDDLAPLFPMDLIGQEVSQERYIPIPDEVREVYKLWRPTPLYRALRLEKELDTPAHIYYKYEGVSPAGSHKPNTAVGPGLLQQAAGYKAHSYRDRRRAVGQRTGLRLPAVWHRVQGLHGAHKLRAEAVSPLHDGDLGRRRGAQPEHGHPVRAEDSRARRRFAGEPGNCDQRGRGGRRHP